MCLPHAPGIQDQKTVSSSCDGAQTMPWTPLVAMLSFMLDIPCSGLQVSGDVYFYREIIHMDMNTKTIVKDTA